MIRIDIFDQSHLLIFRGFLENGSKLKYGRSTKNDIVLPDLSVSRECGEIEASLDGKISITQLGHVLATTKNNEYLIQGFKFKIINYGAIDFEKTQSITISNNFHKHIIAGSISIFIAAILGLLEAFILNFNPNTKATIGWVSGSCIGFAFALIAMGVVSKSVNGQYNFGGFFCYLGCAALGIAISEFDYFYIPWIFGHHLWLEYILNVSMTLFWAWILFSMIRLIFDHAKKWVLASLVFSLFGLISLSSGLKHLDIGDSFEWKAADRAPILYRPFQEHDMSKDDFLNSIDDIAKVTGAVAKKYSEDF